MAIELERKKDTGLVVTYWRIQDQSVCRHDGTQSLELFAYRSEDAFKKNKEQYGDRVTVKVPWKESFTVPEGSNLVTEWYKLIHEQEEWKNGKPLL